MIRTSNVQPSASSDPLVVRQACMPNDPSRVVGRWLGEEEHHGEHRKPNIQQDSRYVTILDNLPHGSSLRKA
jgi:hypothetical protein